VSCLRLLDPPAELLSHTLLSLNWIAQQNRRQLHRKETPARVLGEKGIDSSSEID